MSIDSAHSLVRQSLLSGIEAAQPQTVVNSQMSVQDGTLRVESVDGSAHTYQLSTYDRVIVLGGGNAAGRLSAAVESLLVGVDIDGMVVTDAPGETDQVDQRRGDHPLPSTRNRRHTEDLLAVADQAGADDLVIAAITGGGSALLAAPASGIALSDLQQLTDRLLAAGAPIDAINTARKHCSQIKGGWLADRLAPADVLGVVISDVVGDDLSTIASGPLVSDPTTYEDARSVLEQYGIDVPSSIARHLHAGSQGNRPETPTADFDHVRISIIANNRTALTAAANAVRDAGIRAHLLSSYVRGPASAAGTVHAAIAAESKQTGTPVAPPVALLSGGETTVTVGDQAGVGGPNQEFALAAALELHDLGIDPTAVTVGAVDTDGVDGPTEAAGAIVRPDMIDPYQARNALVEHDVASVLKDWDAQIMTGPTGTNVNDLRVILVGHPDRYPQTE